MEDEAWKMQTQEKIIALASRHGTLPLVYKALRDLDTGLASGMTGAELTSDGPSQSDAPVTRHDLITGLQQTYRSIARQNMLMSAELLKVTRLFEHQDIPAIAFKGPALSQMAYGDITLRQFGDLDILIRREDLLQVLDLLQQEGYIPEITLKENSQEAFFKHLNVIGLYKHSSDILIEIHWELLSKNYAVTWHEQHLWEGKSCVSINHTEIRILHTEHLLLYLCVHGSKHLFERLEWVCDIDRSVRSSQGLDWSKIYSEADRLGIKRMLHLGLSLAQELCGLKLPAMVRHHMEKDPRVPQLAAEIISLHFSRTQHQGKRYSTFILLWKMRENCADRLRFAWYALFAPQINDFKYIQLPAPLAFLYPLIRPFRLIAKYLRKR
jgi:hypothetical protein